MRCLLDKELVLSPCNFTQCLPPAQVSKYFHLDTLNACVIALQYLFVVETNIPYLGQELVTHAPNGPHPVYMSQRVSKAPKMPQLEPTLPTPAPAHKEPRPAPKNKILKPRHKSFVPTKLNPSNIGSLSPSSAKPETFTKLHHSFSSTATTPRTPQNPFIPFSNDRSDVQTSSAAFGGSNSHANAVEKAEERQLKAVIPSPFDPAQELPSFQDIHDMVMFSKKKPKVSKTAKQSKIGKINSILFLK